MARLDVREDLKQGRPPIGRITDAVALLAPEETLVLVTPFEPVPLISMMRGNGYSHVTREISSAHWETVFTPQSLSAPKFPKQPGGDSPLSAGSCASRREDIREVDARGLEPPEPMVKILSELDQIPEGVVLRAFTDRRPLHLLDALVARGFRAESFEQSLHGGWITDIRRG